MDDVHVIPPGEPTALYHSEQAQEGFLVLGGECTPVVECFGGEGDRARVPRPFG